VSECVVIIYNISNKGGGIVPYYRLLRTKEQPEEGTRVRKKISQIQTAKE
jgi:hypothetical protein